MNMGLTLLDELEYARAPMPASAAEQTGLAPSLMRSIPVSGSQRAFQLRSPYFVRALGPTELTAAWGAFCGLLRQHDIPIFSSVESLDGVAAASVPARWSGRLVDEPFQATELTTADLFEVSCLRGDGKQWSWPSEIPSGIDAKIAAKIAAEHLDGLLRSVRAAAGGDTPVGLSVPLGCHLSDLQRCLNADVDFISLSCTPVVAPPAGSQAIQAAANRSAASELRSGGLLAGELHSIVLCRQLLQQLNRPQLPLLVTAPVMDIGQAHKLLALGASAVSIDYIVRQSIAVDRSPSQPEAELDIDLPFRLPSLPQRGASVAKQGELPQLESQLKQARQALVEVLQTVGASSLSDFNQHCLVSASQRAQQVTGVKLLEQ